MYASAYHNYFGAFQPLTCLQGALRVGVEWEHGAGSLLLAWELGAGSLPLDKLYISYISAIDQL
jgi:hypothetical protein